MCTCVSVIGGYPGYEGMLHALMTTDKVGILEPKVRDHLTVSDMSSDSEMSDNT